MKTALSEHSPKRQVVRNLRTLILLRWMLLSARLISLAAAYLKLHLGSEYQKLLWLIAVFFGLNLVTQWRINY